MITYTISIPLCKEFCKTTHNFNNNEYGSRLGIGCDIVFVNTIAI